jgi:RND family efflux transporter MFP subunit
MSKLVKVSLAVLLLLGVAAIGYWAGSKSRIEESGARIQDSGLKGAAKAERKVLYYRNPMGLADTSPVPKKDSMGMDYVAVYEGEVSNENVVNISVDKVQKLGVKSEAAAMRELNTTLRVTGRIEIDERRTYTIAPKFEGWVEKLYVNSTGQIVSKGQPLFEVYSPELVSAQREHALAVQGLGALNGADDETKKSMQRLADASAARLKNWDVAGASLAELPSPQSSPLKGRGSERERQSSTPDSSHITFRAPVSGAVLEKKAVQGMRFMPGEVLYQIADLSSVWVIADVPEQSIAQLQLGSRAQVTVDAYLNQIFDGKVEFIYPTLNTATRTVPIRIALQNSKGLLKPAMYASAQIAVGKLGKVLSIPSSAVIDGGARKVVLVRLAEGRFEPRTVTLGSRSEDYVQVLSGVAEGEAVVTSANFLIDAESNLKAALDEFNRDSSKLKNTSLTPALSRGERESVIAHQAQGVLEAINADGTVSITHQPIKSLNWPGMTMDFALANSALVNGIATGSSIKFELVERAKDEWVITKLQAQHGGH